MLLLACDDAKHVKGLATTTVAALPSLVLSEAPGLLPGPWLAGLLVVLLTTTSLGRPFSG